MVTNSRSPNKLSSEIIKLHRDNVISTIKICQCFAEGWQYYEDGAWDNKQVTQFLTKIHEAGVGPDPKNTVLRQGMDGRFTIGAKSPSFFFIKTVGDHQMFKDPDILKGCQVTGYSVLYQLTRFYDQASGKRKTNHSTAKKKTLALLREGSELTREYIIEQIEKLKPVSHSPQTSEAQNGSAEPVKSTATYSELKERELEFDNLFLTPPSDVLDEVAESSLTSISEKYSYYDVRNGGADVSILVDGSHLNAGLKLASTMGQKSPNIYCITGKPVSSRVLDLTSEKLLITTQEIKAKKAAKNQEATELARNLVTKPDKTNLQLFGDKKTEGWTVCIGSDGSTS